MGQALTTTGFYLYGKRHFTRTGWLKNSASYDPNALDVNLSGKVYAVTGANSGLGYEISKFLAAKGGTLFMICRNSERGKEACNVLAKETKSEDIHLLIGDMSLAADVSRVVQEISNKTKTLNGLVCNAGALLNEKTLTKEGMETTFACHLLNGSYRLSTLLMPLLKATPDSRVVFVSSGGMYNVKWPRWCVATATSGKYDGQLAYAYAKRGQVLLAERWAQEKTHDPVKIVSAHPGWTSTPGVEAAYGSKKSYLEPMRSLWEGTEGIAHCTVRPTDELENGAFYLDRKPQPKILPGIMFGEATGTKNNKEEVDEMMKRLAEACSTKEEKKSQ